MKFLKYNILITLILLILSACNMKVEDPHVHESHGHEHENESKSTSLTPAQMNSIELELGKIEKKQLTASLKANGILTVPNNSRASVTAYLGGIVKNIYVQTGNIVSKGQTIASVANSNFISLQEEYITVTANVELSQLEYDRQNAIQKENAGRLKDLQKADAELKILKARKSSIGKQLQLVGLDIEKLSSDNIQTVLNILSPIDGVISDIKVDLGNYIDANMPIATVVDNHQLHVDLYVYEKDLQKIKVGQTIHFTLTNNPGKEYDADIYAISNTFEEKTKAIAVHALVKGEKQGLIDGMSITALISLENATVEAVPTNAIVHHNGLDFIFIVSANEKEKTATTEHQHNDGQVHQQALNGMESGIPEKVTKFEKVPIRKGTTNIGYSEITLLKDIPENSIVVTNGAFFIMAKMNNTGQAHSH